MSLRKGQKAPDFTLPSSSGMDFTLSENFKGKACIVYFYPRNFTKVCTAEACGFRDNIQEFISMDIPIVGINRDDLATHQRFIKEYDLPFELLSDEDGTVCKAFDALIPILRIPKRITYLLDPNHFIKETYQDMFDAGKHIQKMVATIKGQST